eukprot:12971259-Alexandrium_andersonii.AAC.1
MPGFAPKYWRPRVSVQGAAAVPSGPRAPPSAPAVRAAHPNAANEGSHAWRATPEQGSLSMCPSHGAAGTK